MAAVKKQWLNFKRNLRYLVLRIPNTKRAEDKKNDLRGPRIELGARASCNRWQARIF